MHAAATSKVENLAQGSSCKLKFVHDIMLPCQSVSQRERERDKERERERKWEGGKE
jgi:hypothetical protein